MRGISLEPGCVYDTPAFLTRYFEETHAASRGGQEDLLANLYYRDIKTALEQKGIQIPHYLYPFFYKQGDSEPFINKLIFNRPYGGCSYERLTRVIQNRGYIKRSLEEYYFPHTGPAELQRLINSDHPGVIDLIKQQPVNPVLESYLLYIFLRFDQAAQELSDITEVVYREVSGAQEEFLSQTGNLLPALEKDPVLNKLRAISGFDESGGRQLAFSLSLMDGARIAYHPDEPWFFLLGYDFEQRLEHEYKYCGVTPYSFALAVGNMTKYEIYKILLGKPPMSAADIGRQLHVSRNALTYNLNEMQSSGLVVVDHVKGLTYFYRLDHEYLNVVSRQLAASAAIPG